jgi:hypothetical protein
VYEDNAWNMNIAEGIAFAFRKAIENINSEESRPELRNLSRTWPGYINCDMNNLSPYWLSIGEKMRKNLQDAPVLRNKAGEISIPKRLRFLDWARDQNGNPYPPIIPKASERTFYGWVSLLPVGNGCVSH